MYKGDRANSQWRPPAISGRRTERPIGSAQIAPTLLQREIFGTNEFARLQVALQLAAKGPY